jgi:hypothetical protein
MSGGDKLYSIVKNPDAFQAPVLNRQGIISSKVDIYNELFLRLTNVKIPDIPADG